MEKTYLGCVRTARERQRTVFDVRKFPVISQVINIDKDLRLKLQINGIPFPILKWFLEGRKAMLVKIPILDLILE